MTGTPRNGDMTGYLQRMRNGLAAGGGAGWLARQMESALEMRDRSLKRGPGDGLVAGAQRPAAAGAPDGALGRGRPAASGSVCRRKAARRDFSCRAAARLMSGSAAE